MRIYEPMVAEEDYESVEPCDDRDWETLSELEGQPCGATWKPIAVRRVTREMRNRLKPSDFPWLGSNFLLVMRRSAVVALRDILDAHGELLPLATHDGVALFVFNARAIDALDEPHSSLLRFPGTNRIMMIEKHAFFPSAIRGLDIFRLPMRASATYVSERFAERVKEAGLRGLVFNEVWSG